MSRPRPRREPARCRWCDLPVRWWPNTKRDTVLCVDWSPDPGGYVRQMNSQDPVTREPVTYGQVLTDDEVAAAHADGTDAKLFTLHSRTCSAQKPRNPKPEGLQILRPDGTPLKTRKGL